MTSKLRVTCLSSLALLLPLVVPAAAEDPTPPPWTEDQLIEMLDVQPEPEVLFKSRGLIVVEDEPAEKPGSGVVRDLRILFEFDSADLTAEGARRLDVLAAAMESGRLHDDDFRILGHTDAVGDEGYNLDLSRRRAEAVVDYLVDRHSIARTRLVEDGLGESQLFDPDDPTSAVNRRVEVVNLRAGEG